VRGFALYPERKLRRARTHALGFAAFAFRLSRVSFARRARANLTLARGRDSVHTFARLKFPLSRIYGDVPACGLNEATAFG
jgi:hypothetical protein